MPVLICILSLFSARGGELFNHIDLNGKLDEKCVIRLMGQILDGLAFLHHQNILHMDIKVGNGQECVSE